MKLGNVFSANERNIAPGMYIQFYRGYKEMDGQMQSPNSFFIGPIANFMTHMDGSISWQFERDEDAEANNVEPYAAVATTNNTDGTPMFMYDGYYYSYYGIKNIARHSESCNTGISVVDKMLIAGIDRDVVDELEAVMKALATTVQTLYAGRRRDLRQLHIGRMLLELSELFNNQNPPSILRRKLLTKAQPPV